MSGKRSSLVCEEAVRGTNSAAKIIARRRIWIANKEKPPQIVVHDFFVMDVDSAVRRQPSCWKECRKLSSECWIRKCLDYLSARRMFLRSLMGAGFRRYHPGGQLPVRTLGKRTRPLKER